jgi:YD repeat-containing protein
MRKQIFYFIGAMLLAFSFSSCGKSDNCDPNDKDSPCYANGAGVKLLLIEQKINGEIVGQFDYDNQNRRIRYTLATGLIEYSYNAKGLLSVAVYKDLTGKVTQRDDFTYGSDDKPISMVISFPNRPYDAPTNVTYTYTNNKIVETSIPQEPGGQVSTNTFLFNVKGNLTDLITATGGQEFTTSWSEFDDKSSAALQGDPYHWKNSKNNAQRFQITSQIFSIDQKWVYTYNKESYPVKALVYNNGSTIVSEEHIFTYKASK